MSEETLRRFLERLNRDASFRDGLQADPEQAFAEFELSPAERVALAYSDEDALRRLAGLDVTSFMESGSIGCLPRPFPTGPGSGCRTAGGGPCPTLDVKLCPIIDI